MVNKSIVDAVVTMLRMYDVDGETMEHIINEVGMRDQMIKQLVTNKEEMNDDDDVIVASFTKDTLIEYTRTIQERVLETVKAAIKESRVDIESHIELDLYDKTIEVSLNEDYVYDEIISNIEDVFEIDDDDSVWDEVSNVITFMK